MSGGLAERKIMKKYLSVLLTLCIVLGTFTIAYAEDDKKPFEYDEKAIAEEVVSFIEEISTYNAEDIEYICRASYGLTKEIYEGYLAYAKGDTLGKYKGIVDEDIKFVEKEDTVECVVVTDYENSDLKFTFVYKEIIGSISIVDVNYELISEDESLGSVLAGAGLNTLMGMSIVVLMLAGISFVISLFRFIPMLQDKFAAKKAGKEEIKEVVTEAPKAVEEELVDDTELVAVITAAISAATNTSGDSFVVRSIRRRF